SGKNISKNISNAIDHAIANAIISPSPHTNDGPTMKSLRDKFMSKWEPVTETGCWLWTGAAGRYGILVVRRNGKSKTLRAHRVAYELFRGEVPAGQVVCHRCDVPFCVNPDHLFTGTQRDNLLDGVRKGRIQILPMKL